MEKCLICDMDTINVIRGHSICLCCEDKFGSFDKIKEKLLSMDIPSALIADLTIGDEDEKEVFKCDLKYSGGTKQDIINMIVNLMDTERISLDEIERNRF